MPTKYRNKNKIYDEDDESLLEDKIKEEDFNEYQKLNEGSWYNCKLPNENKYIKVQFILQNNEEPTLKKE